MTFAVEIKTEPTQAATIIAVVAFSSGSLAMTTIYANNSTVSTFCAVVLAIVIYLALHFSPRVLSSTAIHPSAVDPDESPTVPAVPPTVNFPVAATSTIGPMIFSILSSPWSPV